MKLEDAKIKKVLLGGNYVSAEDLVKAEEKAKENKKSLLEAVFDLELINNDLLGQAIAEYFGLMYADVNSNPPPKEQVLKIPEELARKNRVILFFEDPARVVFATDDPSNEQLSAALPDLFPNKEVYLAFCLPDDLDSMLSYYRKDLNDRLRVIIEKDERVAPEIVDEVVEDALTLKASDIHFDPNEQDSLIRFRIDGVLQEAGRIPKKVYANILNRIKVQSRLRTDEHFSAQDGAIRYKLKNSDALDMRVSIVPALDGEKLVIRMLAKYAKGLSMSDLGLNEANETKLKEASKKPFGMILVVGPTGSGKTTTLYSVLKTLNRPEVNIATIEDPVEYKIEGVNHIQVNQQTNLTFSKGLRSIVRQDPDIILVGEIRDQETSEIAVNAALTGHLLLSTFHANDAATAIPRLLDMGVEPFLLSSTLELVVAQRLARKICGKCKHSYSASEEELLKDRFLSSFFKKGENLYKGKGCESCNYTGYKGRSAVFELISITPEMKDLILENPSSGEIWELAFSQGSESIFEDGIEKVKSGFTTLEELLRVAQPPKKLKVQVN